jgi:hypothetical protein
MPPKKPHNVTAEELEADDEWGGGISDDMASAHVLTSKRRKRLTIS